MSHEQTITVGIDKKFYNIKTVINGQKVSDKIAIDFAIKNRKLGMGFDSLGKAVASAENRSRNFSMNRRLGLISHRFEGASSGNVGGLSARNKKLN